MDLMTGGMHKAMIAWWKSAVFRASPLFLIIAVLSKKAQRSFIKIVKISYSPVQLVFNGSCIAILGLCQEEVSLNIISHAAM